VYVCDVERHRTAPCLTRVPCTLQTSPAPEEALQFGIIDGVL